MNRVETKINTNYTNNIPNVFQSNMKWFNMSILVFSKIIFYCQLAESYPQQNYS